MISLAYLVSIESVVTLDVYFWGFGTYAPLLLCSTCPQSSSVIIGYDRATLNDNRCSCADVSGDATNNIRNTENYKFKNVLDRSIFNPYYLGRTGEGK